MKDVFKEQMVKKSKTLKEIAIMCALITLAVFLSFLAVLFLGGLALIALGIIGFILYYVFNLFKQEFEYIFTNGELDIDCIYGKARRKRKFACDVKEATLLAHANNSHAEKELESAQATMNFGSGTINENTWYLLTPYKGKRVKVIFEPNENMLAAMRPFISPRKTYKKL